MEIKNYCESLAESFINNPANFVNESDLVMNLAYLLRENFKPIKIPSNKSIFENYSFGYKDGYRKKIEEKITEFDRIHLETSVNKGERIDTVVFKEDIDSINWIKNGSKRFNNTDVGAAVEVKFIKNKRYFPKNNHNTELDGLNIDDFIDEIDLEENKIKGDIEELNDLETEDVYLLIFSNNDYIIKVIKEKVTTNGITFTEN